jgi:hypothetical protein
MDPETEIKNRIPADLVEIAMGAFSELCKLGQDKQPEGHQRTATAVDLVCGVWENPGDTKPWFPTGPKCEEYVRAVRSKMGLEEGERYGEPHVRKRVSRTTTHEDGRRREVRSKTPELVWDDLLIDIVVDELPAEVHPFHLREAEPGETVYLLQGPSNPEDPIRSKIEPKGVTRSEDLVRRWKEFEKHYVEELSFFEPREDNQ